MRFIIRRSAANAALQRTMPPASERHKLTHEQGEAAIRLVCREKMSLLGRRNIRWQQVRDDLCRKHPELTHVTPAQIKDYYNTLKRRRPDLLSRIAHEVQLDDEKPPTVQERSCTDLLAAFDDDEDDAVIHRSLALPLLFSEPDSQAKRTAMTAMQTQLLSKHA